MIELLPRIAAGRIEQRMKLVASLAEALAYTGSRPLSNHAWPGAIVRAGSPSTRSSMLPAIRQRMPPPWCRCASASPPRSKSTRSQRIRKAALPSSLMSCSSNRVERAPAAGVAGASAFTSSYLRMLAPVGPAATAQGPAPCHASLAFRLACDAPASIETCPSSAYRTRFSGGSGVRKRACGSSSSRVRRNRYPFAMTPS